MKTIEERIASLKESTGYTKGSHLTKGFDKEGPIWSFSITDESGPALFFYGKTMEETISKAEKYFKPAITGSKLPFDYMQTPLYRFTFQNKRIREWVEHNSKGKVLNLFAGKNLLNVNEVRNDCDPDMPADYHIDALEFVNSWAGEFFDTVVLDPPYSYRKSMEMYKGNVTSPFNALKDGICRILNDKGAVITFGYHSVSMGKKRGFNQERLLVMSHGGAIHDTIAIIERKL